MAITYSVPGGTGTLSPPILNGIEEVNTDNNLILNSVGAGTLYFNGFNVIQISNVACEFDFLIDSINIEAASGINIQASTTITISAPIVNLSLIKSVGSTTTGILSITPLVGMQIFNTTLNQMFWYQVSPITGLVLGWYNSTGNIKL